MSCQSSSRLILLGIVIFSTIGMGSADVNILVSKGSNINVVEIESLQGTHMGMLVIEMRSRLNAYILAGSLPQLDNCSESPLPRPSTVKIKSCSNNVKYPIFIACYTITGTGT
jgi:hypothetical protein